MISKCFQKINVLTKSIVYLIEDLTRTVLILLAIYTIGSLFAFIRAWVFTQAGMRLVARLRKQLFASIIKQEIAFFDDSRYVHH